MYDFGFLFLNGFKYQFDIVNNFSFFNLISITAFDTLKYSLN